MSSGHIKWFNPYKNYGYIMLPDVAEAPFFSRQFAFRWKSFVGHLGPGQGVSFLTLA